MHLTCDADNVATAYVVVFSPDHSGELHLCAHHYAEHMPALLVQGWALQLDRREELVSA